MTGDRCIACGEQGTTCAEAAADLDAHACRSRRCRASRASSGQTSLCGFLSDAVANQGKPRRRPFIPALHGLVAEAVDDANVAHRKRAPKVRFDLDVVEFPVTPCGKYVAEYEMLLAQSDTDSSEDEKAHSAHVGKAYA